jgi:hypothetical protein
VPGDVVEIELGRYRIRVATAFGPRVLGLSCDGGPEIFASLPEVVIDRPDSGVYRFRGGHRLWASPELPPITYAPDDEPCSVTREDESISIVGPVDRAGLVKRMTLSGDSEGVVVDHELVNAGAAIIELAPWALSQIRLGGVAIVPVAGKPDEYRLSASSNIVIWPYTDLADPRVTWDHAGLLVRAEPGPPFKVGTGPAPGRLGYLIEGHLFTKQVPSAGPDRYPDRGAVAQFYLGDAFCELESVGPLSVLDPGGSVTHREVWEIEECEDVATAARRLMVEAGP